MSIDKDMSDMIVNILYVGKGKRNASPIFCVSASCSNLVSIGSDKLSNERPAGTANVVVFCFFFKNYSQNPDVTGARVATAHRRASW